MPERLYRIFHAMKTRCYNPNSPKYKNYGGRGIQICDEWKSFSVFKEWALKNGYSDNLTIDRINNDGNYEPGNCKWSTLQEQADNRSSNYYVVINGERKTLKDWSDISGIKWNTIKARINLGWNPKDAVFLPVCKIPYRLRSDRVSNDVL